MSHACASIVEIWLCDRVSFFKYCNPNKPPFLIVVNMLKSSCSKTRFLSGQKAPSSSILILFLFNRNSFKLFKLLKLKPWICCRSFLFISLQNIIHSKYIGRSVLTYTCVNFVNIPPTRWGHTHNICSCPKLVNVSFNCVKLFLFRRSSTRSVKLSNVPFSINFMLFALRLLRT